MTVCRAAALLVTFAAIALGVVFLRGEQTRTAARIHQLQVSKDRLRHESWDLQMEIARLRTPDLIRERVERWQLNVLAPCPGPGWRAETGMADAR